LIHDPEHDAEIKEKDDDERLLGRPKHGCEKMSRCEDNIRMYLRNR
jgi:hypothetical protein